MDKQTTDTDTMPSKAPDTIRLLSGESAEEVKVEDPTEKLGHLFLKMFISGLVGIAASMASDKALDAWQKRRYSKTTETTNE